MRPERVQQKWNPVLRPDTRQNKQSEQDDDSKKSQPALVERVVNDIHDLAGADVDQQQIRPIADPLKAGLRRRQSERSVIGIEIGRRQEDRRQYPADDPTLVGEAGRIDEGGEMDAIERPAMIIELRSAGTGPSESWSRTWAAGTRAWTDARARAWSWAWRWSMRGNRWLATARSAGRRLAVRLFGRGQCWRRQRKHRDNSNRASNYAQHSDLSFFGLLRIYRNRHYQIAPDHVTHHSRQHHSTYSVPREKFQLYRPLWEISA
jgi:hypothetical protein